MKRTTVKYSKNGTIGRSGRWYGCGIAEHTQTEINNKSDAPFAIVRTHYGDTHVSFDAYYTANKTYPTQAQFETLMDWCTQHSKRFEHITDCWDLPWEPWR